MRRRDGFTLVELLVVIILIGTLAGMTIMFMPAISGQAREASGAQQVQGWLNQARLRAQRDQAPRGLRFWYQQMDGAAQQVLVSELEYIEQPDDYRGDPMFTNWLTTDTPAAPGTFTYNANAIYLEPPIGLPPDVVNGQASAANWNVSQGLWHIQPGDFIEVEGDPNMHRVLTPAELPPGSTPPGVNWPIFWDSTISPATAPIFKVLLNSPVSIQVMKMAAVPSRRAYRVVRQPRPTGDDKLTLPNAGEDNVPEVVIDLNTNVRFGAPLFPLTPNPFTATPLPAGTRGYGDLLFGPSGAVLLPRISAQTIPLWVRSFRTNEPFDDTRFFRGEPGLIAVYLGSGAVASYPVNHGNLPYVMIQ